MARTKADPTVVRPGCPEHPRNRVWLDGFEPCRWSDVHRRPRYRCVTDAGTKGHSFSLPVAVRQPTERHPDSGAGCPTCERRYARHEGVPTGRDFVFGHAEIARLFLRIGEGMSLRAASQGAARLGLPLARSGDEPPGEPRGRLPRCLRPCRRGGPPSHDLATHPRARCADPLHTGLPGQPGHGH